MSDPLEALTPAIESSRVLLQTKLMQATDALVADFDITIGNLGLLTCHVEANGESMPIRLYGSLTLDLVRGAYRTPFKPPASSHQSDIVLSAGRYVLDGVQVTSNVSVPAYNGSSLELLAILPMLSQFTQILRDAEMYLTGLLRAEKLAIGQRFLKGPSV